MARYRVVFFGTPEFAVPSLQALLEGPDEVVGVVCQPDRPAGRGQRLHAPPVKELARAQGIPIVQPEKLRDVGFAETMRAWSPDIAVVAAYGRILPKEILAVPRLGCINVHASLLPKYRGAAPIQWAILRGEECTGVTIMQMNERMDEGDILLQVKTPIGSEETYGELQQRLSSIGARALMEALSKLHEGTLVPVPQDHVAASLAPMIKKEQGEIRWHLSAEEISRQIRAFNPWPSAYTWLEEKLLKVHAALPRRSSAPAPAGTVIATGETIDVATGDGVLAVTELQMEGRKRLSAREFSRGRLIASGMRLGKDQTTG
jgi:methionyl-tRNA formyltransferase